MGAGSLHHVGPGGQTRIFRFVGRHIYPLNHLTSPYFFLQESHIPLSVPKDDPELRTLSPHSKTGKILGIYCHAQLKSQLKKYIFLFMCVLYMFECSRAEARRECHSP